MRSAKGGGQLQAPARVREGRSRRTSPRSSKAWAGLSSIKAWLRPGCNCKRRPRGSGAVGPAGRGQLTKVTSCGAARGAAHARPLAGPRVQLSPKAAWADRNFAASAGPAAGGLAAEGARVVRDRRSTEGWAPQWAMNLNRLPTVLRRGHEASEGTCLKMCVLIWVVFREQPEAEKGNPGELKKPVRSGFATVRI